LPTKEAFKALAKQRITGEHKNALHGPYFFPNAYDLALIGYPRDFQIEGYGARTR
jgi:hypothetical protein